WELLVLGKAEALKPYMNRRAKLHNVSSPPMGMSVSMPSHARFLRTSEVRSFFSAVKLSFKCAGTLDLLTRPGFVREEWRKVPPVRAARSTTSCVSTRKLSELS